jgi:hypothetical protein
MIAIADHRKWCSAAPMEESTMFFRLGLSLINSQHVREIRPIMSNSGVQKATVVFQDGEERTDFLTVDRADDLFPVIVPAPPGFECLDFIDYEDGQGERLEREPVVALAYRPGEEHCAPVTARYGLMSRFVLRSPNGTIYTSDHAFFADEQSYLTWRGTSSTSQAA